MTVVKIKPYNPEGYVIRMCEEALIQMCLSGLEAYVVRHETENGKKNKLETYGLLWGNEVTLPNRETLYDVRFVTTDTSAVRARSSVEPESMALELKRDAMTSFWPQYDFLGDFHTHAYNISYQRVRQQKRYQYSEGDFVSFESSDYWRRHGARVGLVLTITCLAKKGSLDPDWVPGEDSAIEFTLGNYRMWLKGYVIFEGEDGLEVSADDDEDVLLDCPALVGLVGEYTRFGKAVMKRGRVKHECGSV